jgi:hypothetical protein
MVDRGWGIVARRAARINAVCYVLGSLLFVLVSFGVTLPAPPAIGTAYPNHTAAEWTAAFAMRRAAWPQEVLYQLLFVAGFLALVPLGLAVRELSGRGGVHPELAAAAFAVGALLGTSAQLVGLGVAGAVVGISRFLGPETPPATFLALSMVDGVAGEAASWLLRGFFLVTGFAVYQASRLGGQDPRLPLGWARLGLLVALLYWLGLAAQLLAALGDVRQAELAYRLLVLVGGTVVAPFWVWRLGDAVGSPASNAPT